MLRCPINKLLVSIDKKYQDKQGNLFIDTTFQPEEYATLKGTVMSIPDRVDDEHYKGDIEQLAKIGDEVWFSYGVVYDYAILRDGETPVYKNLLAIDGEEYWKVRYEEVFCILRDGEILMPTQNVLLVPVIKQGEQKTAGGLISLQKTVREEDKAMIVALPKTNISCKVGDIVPLELEFTQQYIMFDKPHYIFSTRRLIATY